MYLFLNLRRLQNFFFHWFLEILIFSFYFSFYFSFISQFSFSFKFSFGPIWKKRENSIKIVTTHLQHCDVTLHPVFLLLPYGQGSWRGVLLSSSSWRLNNFSQLPGHPDGKPGVWIPFCPETGGWQGQHPSRQPSILSSSRQAPHPATPPANTPITHHPDEEASEKQSIKNEKNPFATTKTVVFVVGFFFFSTTIFVAQYKSEERDRGSPDGLHSTWSHS